MALNCTISLKAKLLLLPFLFLALTATSQSKQSVLWEISGKGLQQKSYLFGTIHPASPSILNNFPIEKYLSKAQFGLFEVFGDPINPVIPTPNRVPERPQPPLDSLFSKEEFTLVDSFFISHGVESIKEDDDEASLIDMYYFAISLLNNPSSDLVLLDKGIADTMAKMGKPLFRLDADDDPDIIKFVTNYAFLAEAIVNIIKNSKEGEMFSDYENTLKVDMLLKKEARVENATVRRNLLWYPQIVEKMQEGACFVAVGLGHLQYKTGLIMQLRQNGYKVKPVALRSLN